MDFSREQQSSCFPGRVEVNAPTSLFSLFSDYYDAVKEECSGFLPELG